MYKEYPLLSAVIKEWPGTVIDWVYEEILDKQPDKLKELLTLTKKQNYTEVLNEYEGSTLEELFEELEVPKTVYDVTYFRKDGDVIDTTQIDEENNELAWELFKEFGHTKQDGDYLEFEEVDED